MRHLFSYLLWLVKGVQVFALVGKSGTGKSFRARFVAQKYGIELLIDDGLLIYDKRIIAGKSAKRELYFLSAIKTALFDSKKHRDEVRQSIERHRHRKVLILGTSERMVRLIAQRLELPAPTRIIYIEDIATKDEIETALMSRKTEGKHVIPVPATEIKRNYPQIFYDSVKIFFRKQSGVIRTRGIVEKTVVRPEFSPKSKIPISDAGVAQIAFHAVSEYSPNLAATRVTVRTEGYGYLLDVAINVRKGYELTGNLAKLQNHLTETIEQITGLFIEETNLLVERDDIALP